jgi:hypothetical protein
MLLQNPSLVAWKERIRKRIYKTPDLARADIFDYVDVFYAPQEVPLGDNRTRRHSHLARQSRGV